MLLEVLTGERKHTEGFHGSEMRQSEIADLRTPPQVQRFEARHRWQIAEAYVGYMNAAAKTRSEGLKSRYSLSP